MRIEQVSRLLGHKNVRTTECYSAWVKERQRKLEAEVKQAWTKMDLPLAPVPNLNGTSATPDLAGLSIDGRIQ